MKTEFGTDIGVVECVEWAIARTGVVEAGAAVWIGRVIEDAWNHGIAEIARRVRGKATGTGDLWLAAMTEAGHELGEVEAAHRLVANAMSCWYRLRDDDRADHYATFPGYVAEFSAVKDRNTCAHAIELHGKAFRLNKRPALPLEGCDVHHCRCSWRFSRKRSAR